MTNKKQVTKYVITECNFGNQRISTFHTKEEWKKVIDKFAENTIRGEFYVDVYEFEEEIQEEIETKKIKIFGTQGRRDRSVYVDTIPEEWGEPIFSDKIQYFEISENEEGKFVSSTDTECTEYDSYEECYDVESPSQYINY